MRLFLNTFPHMQANIFSGSCHEVSSMSLIRFVVWSNTMEKFVSLTYFTKPVL